MSWKHFFLVTIPCVAITFNDNFFGITRVKGETYLCGAPNKPLSHTENSWILVNRSCEPVENSLVVVTDPFEPNRQLVRNIKGVGEKFILDIENEEIFPVFLKRGFVYLEALLKKTNSDTKQKHNLSSSLSSKKGDTDTNTMFEDTLERYDSLIFGATSVSLLRGKPIAVIYPFERAGIYRSLLKQGERR